MMILVCDWWRLTKQLNHCNVFVPILRSQKTIVGCLCFDDLVKLETAFVQATDLTLLQPRSHTGQDSNRATYQIGEYQYVEKAKNLIEKQSFVDDRRSSIQVHISYHFSTNNGLFSLESSPQNCMPSYQSSIRVQAHALMPSLRFFLLSCTCRPA